MRRVYREETQLLEKESTAKGLRQEQCTALTFQKTENGQVPEDALPAENIQWTTGTKSAPNRIPSCLIHVNLYLPLLSPEHWNMRSHFQTHV